MSGTRLLPEKLMIGDTLRAEFCLPMSPDGDPWTAARLRLVRVRDTSRTAESDDGVLTDKLAEVELAATATAEMPDGVWRYQITASTAGGVVRTIELGVIDIVDPLAPTRNFNERMVDIVRSVIELRMTESGAVSNYTIGDRQLGLMPMPQLQRMLGDYEERLAFERKPRHYRLKRRINW